MFAGGSSLSIAAALVSLFLAAGVAAEMPTHPILTEVFTDPNGANDGPVGRDPANVHQEFIEFYLPTALDLESGLNKDALNLTLYEVEGDTTSSGYTLVNYRIDLPTFDLDADNGITDGAIARPSSGVVVIGWVDYVGDPPTDLAGSPGSRVGLVNGGVTLTTDYLFIAMNGAQFSGTTNFPVPDAVSLINMPNEARSGVIQNGSGAYLLVDRDNVGYVELYDDKDTAHVPPVENADPRLREGSVLQTSCFLDGLAGNDHSAFDVTQQPYQQGDDVDLANVLPEAGAFTLLIPQVGEDDEHGYLRIFADVAKTTEDGMEGNEDPVADALNAYRTISNLGPWFATPGRVTFTSSPPELSVADEQVLILDVLASTTAQLGLFSANVGGDFAMQVTATPGASSDPASVTFVPGDPATVATGQTAVFPSITASVSPTAVHSAMVATAVSVEGVLIDPGDPAVVNPTWLVTATVHVLNPTTGLDAAGQPLETTVFVAVQGIPADSGVTNELLTTDLGTFLAAQPDITALHTLGHGPALINAGTDLENPLVVRPMIKKIPSADEECAKWLPRAGVPLPGFADRVATSAEVASGATTYDESIGTCDERGETVIKAIRVNIPDTKTFDGTFSPSERIHFVNPKGNVGDVRSGLTNVTTSRTFEVALVDTAVNSDGSLETGASDDFGIVVEVQDTEPGAPVVDGDYLFLSFSGGLEGADIDTLEVPPGEHVATLILLDLDNLHDVLGIRSIEAVFIISGSGGGDVDIIEGFSLNLSGSSACTVDGDCADGRFCNGIERCVSGACQPGSPVSCDDGLACTSDSCNGATDSCSYIPNHVVCDDSLFCTGLDYCDPGVGCVSSGNPCADPANCDEDADTCGCLPSSAPTAELFDTQQLNSKNRFLSVAAGDPSRKQAIRVRFVGLPWPFDVWNYEDTGQEFFVGAPREVCENSGKGLETAPEDCPDALPTTRFWAAPLVCGKGAAHFMDWHGACLVGRCLGGLKQGRSCTADEDCQGTVHLFHEGIVPHGVYEIQVVDSGCSLQEESGYSAALTMTQTKWGDVCGPGPGGACSGVSDGIVDVQNDVLGVLDKFANVNDLQKTRADLEPGDFDQNNGPDLKVNVANDVLYCLDAFRAAPYPFAPGDPCNPG